MHLGKGIKAALALKGITQKELANRLELNENTIGRWVSSGSLPAKRLEQIAGVLDMSVSTLVAYAE